MGWALGQVDGTASRSCSPDESQEAIPNSALRAASDESGGKCDVSAASSVGELGEFTVEQEGANPEPKEAPAASVESEDQLADASRTRTKLKIGAPLFQPVPTDTRMHAVANAANLVLVSCGEVQNISMEVGAAGASATSISAELQSGPDASTRAYNVMHITKQALEAVTERLQTTRLLSARIQKDDGGYTLRSSIACLPNGVEDCMCWDMFHKGHCPRRSHCQWYHPHASDIAKIKISIRYEKKSAEAKSGDEAAAKPSAQRHKLLLGELIH